MLSCKVLQRKVEYMYMNTRQKTKGGTYINRRHILRFTSLHKLQQFRLQIKIESSGFLSKCDKHVVRRTVLAMAMQQEKRL